MTVITSAEIQEYQAQLKDYPDVDVKAALDAIANNNGNLEAAFAELAQKNGEAGFRQMDLEELANRCRDTVCSKPTEDFLGLLNLVAGFLPPPVSLAVPVALFILKIGIRNYCRIPEAA
ncbi:hypothetical protein [Brunnivagina elsteri]|uniref:Uncharacterized protein n=1 Tax=Brunnivagina elsteri CCALA 953 TaxID=987040 RepID=A0A2A2TMH5_9CYAN|nr:hypothetical protein [Calothrix elsteri]PAX59595.1 hypothetical protein CK510_06360 [Calothrix elsteri CCALA 953]